jgi:hypothetical protein
MQQTSHEPHAPPATLARAYPRSAAVFYGFALLIVADTVLAGTLNPDRGEVEFWIKAVVILGSLLAWAVWIGRRLSRGAGVVAANAFLGCLSALVLIGTLMALTGGYPAATPFPGMKVMSTARAISGLYVLVAWVVLVWETLARRADRGASAA